MTPTASAACSVWTGAGWTMERCCWDGDLNLLKGAILTADAVNAVSPTYAQELKNPYFAHRMEGILTQCGYKLSGVLNGIDMKLYDPAADPRIAANYTAEDVSGKAADKAALQKALGLRPEPETPIIAMVSRLVTHKGLDLIREVMGDIMELPVQFVLLAAETRPMKISSAMRRSAGPERDGHSPRYDEALSMAIYAGADLFLMPSRSEPCGLSQMIAMRYGTVPIVRETGGLKDTVQPYEAWRDAGTGFTFANYSSADMLHVLREAAYLYKDYPDAFARLRRRAMERDFSWNRSAGDYLKIYAAVTGAAAAASESDDTEALKAEVPTAAAEPAKKRTSARKAVSGKAAKPVKAASAKKRCPPRRMDGARVPKTAEKSTKTRKTGWIGREKGRFRLQTQKERRRQEGGGVIPMSIPFTTQTLQEALTAKLALNFGTGAGRGHGSGDAEGLRPRFAGCNGPPGRADRQGNEKRAEKAGPLSLP